VGIYPEVAEIAGGASDGVFTRYSPAAPPASDPVASVAQLREAGPPRDIPLGRIFEPVAAEPTDADFAKAAAWRIRLPAGIDPATDPILRVRYVGDVARITLNGRLLVDDFYNGNALDLGIRRYLPEISGGDLEIAILPLRKDAVLGANRRIFLADSAMPDFGSAGAAVGVESTQVVARYEVGLPALDPR
jgi:beta-galactosidase